LLSDPNLVGRVDHLAGRRALQFLFSLAREAFAPHSNKFATVNPAREASIDSSEAALGGPATMLNL
jgi:hypothetical protein